MTKNHSGRYLQNLGICFKKGNPVFKKGNPFSTKGNPVSKKGNPAFRGKPIWRQNLKTTGGPGRARIGPPVIFPTSAFSRRSGGKKTTLRLRGGQASGVPPGAFAEVGRRICLREASRRSGMHRKPAREAENPRAWAGVGQIQARQAFSRPPILRGRAKFCPASIYLTSQWPFSARLLETSPITKTNPAIQVFHFPTKNLAVRNYAESGGPGPGGAPSCPDGYFLETRARILTVLTCLRKVAHCTSERPREGAPRQVS